MLLNAAQKKPLYKVGLYASPGRGKTHIGATAPKPLILLFERHGFETVRTASKMHGVPMPPVIWVRTLGQFGRIKTILATSKTPIRDMMLDEEVVSDVALTEANTTREDLVANLPYECPETVVVDSLTEACEMVAKGVDANGGTETKGGLTYRKLRAWGPIEQKCKSVIRQFRDLPFHVLFICLLDERNVGSEDDPEYHYRPALPGRKLWRHMTASVNAVGMLRVVAKKDEGTGKVVTRRFVQFMGPEQLCTKQAFPLRAREPADAGAWFDALENGVESACAVDEEAAEDDSPVDGGENEEAKEEKPNE